METTWMRRGQDAGGSRDGRDRLPEGPRGDALARTPAVHHLRNAPRPGERAVPAGSPAL